MRFRTRTQEVEAIEYTGDNAAEVMSVCATASAHSDGEGNEWIQVLDRYKVRSIATPGDYILEFEDGWAVTVGEWFEKNHVPVPDLVRTVADYEGLPVGSIVAVVSYTGRLVGPWVIGRPIYVEHTDKFSLADLVLTADELVRDGFVCSVVRLGGDGQ